MNYIELKYKGEGKYLDSSKPGKDDLRFWGKNHKIEAVFWTTVMVALIPFMFSISLFTGLISIFAVAGCIYRGLIFHQHGFAIYLIAGFLLSVLLGKILPMIFGWVRTIIFGEFLMLVCTLIIYYNAYSFVKENKKAKKK